jgi:hypothetical protein
MVHEDKEILEDQYKFGLFKEDSKINIHLNC